jgi:putative flippase GtrA
MTNPDAPENIPAAGLGPIRSRLAMVKKAGSFAAIGVVNASIDFAVFWTAVYALAVEVIPANVLSWAVAVSASYVMNSFFTFAAESGRKLRWKSYFTFAAGGIAGLVANTAALLIGDWFLGLFLSGENLRLALAKIGAIGASFIVNFSMSHFVVFRAPPADRQRT